MFKLSRLILHNMDDSQTFTYEFSEGINYFVGKNDSGKTEFYTFLDYMFGADYPLFKRDWYKDSLLYASLHICIDKIEFVLTRYLRDSNKNYLHYADEPCGEPLRLDEYKERINNIFTRNTECLRELRAFVGEDLGYHLMFQTRFAYHWGAMKITEEKSSFDMQIQIGLRYLESRW